MAFENKGMDWPGDSQIMQASIIGALRGLDACSVLNGMPANRQIIRFVADLVDNVDVFEYDTVVARVRGRRQAKYLPQLASLREKKADLQNSIDLAGYARNALQTQLGNKNNLLDDLRADLDKVRAEIKDLTGEY